MMLYSMWAGVGSTLALWLDGAVSVLLPASASPPASRASSLSVPDLSGILGFLSYLGMFVNLPLFFSVLGLVLAWRGAWLVYRLVRTIEQVIPFVG